MLVKRVFIASPNDCIYERNCVDTVIEELRYPVRQLFGVVLECVRWENMPPIFDSAEASAWQHRINKELETCDIFIGMLNRKYGTPIPSLGNKSGTHCEFSEAIERQSDIVMLTYHRKYSQRAQVPKNLRNLKAELAKKSVPYQEHSTRVEFIKRIRRDLLVAIGMSLLPQRKRKNLKKFFLLTGKKSDSDTGFTIVYPPIHAAQPNDASRNCNWRQRLLPDVIFEDFKAIEKIEAALSIIGVKNHEAVTCDAPETHARKGNIVWLCIPRNELAKKHLRAIRERVRFKFVEQESAGDRHILWKNNATGKSIKIRSPLGEYLRRQRPGANRKWDVAYANVYARDFAVISRFKRGANFSKEPCYHYFMAGIRGLGTWGAGKLISRHHQKLADILPDDDSDFQAILQVTYIDREVANVRIVSDRDQAYFDGEMDPDTIQGRIDGYR